MATKTEEYTYTPQDMGIAAYLILATLVQSADEPTHKRILENMRNLKSRLPIIYSNPYELSKMENLINSLIILERDPNLT